MRNLRALLALPFGLLACGNPTPPKAPPAPEPVATAAPAATSAPEPAPPAVTARTEEKNIPLADFKIVSTDPADKGAVVLDVHKDGNISSKSAKWGKIDGKRVVADGSTDPMWTVEKDGTVKWSVLPDVKLHFDDKDALVVEGGKGGATLTVDDAGNVLISSAKGKDAPPWRVEGMSPSARRAAALLSMSIPRKKGK